MHGPSHHQVVEIDAATGHDAGALRQAAIAAGQWPAPSGVAALVAVTAQRLATGTQVAVVVSGDGDDMEILASLAEGASSQMPVLIVSQ